MTKHTSAHAAPIQTAEDLKTSGRPTITADEASALLSLDRRVIYRCMDDGEIPEIRFQTRRLIPRETREVREALLRRRGTSGAVTTPLPPAGAR